MNKGKKKEVNGRLLPGKYDEYFLYQTLLGYLPFYADEYPPFEEEGRGLSYKSRQGGQGSFRMEEAQHLLRGVHDRLLQRYPPPGRG